MADRGPAARQSKYRGLTWYAAKQLWRVTIMVRGEQIYLGQHADEEGAANLYREASLKHLGVYDCPLRGVAHRGVKNR